MLVGLFRFDQPLINLNRFLRFDRKIGRSPSIDSPAQVVCVGSVNKGVFSDYHFIFIMKPALKGDPD